jgi:hypothetical protein
MLITGPSCSASSGRLPRAGRRPQPISPHGWSELNVDGRGNACVNTINFDFADFNDVLTSGSLSLATSAHHVTA